MHCDKKDCKRYKQLDYYKGAYPKVVLKVVYKSFFGKEKTVCYPPHSSHCVMCKHFKGFDMYAGG